MIGVVCEEGWAGYETSKMAGATVLKCKGLRESVKCESELRRTHQPSKCVKSRQALDRLECKEGGTH